MSTWHYSLTWNTKRANRWNTEKEPELLFKEVDTQPIQMIANILQKSQKK